MLAALKNSALAWELRRTPVWKRYRQSAGAGREFAFYRNLIDRDAPGCILDVGASQGAKAEMFRRLASRVIAIEPDPTSADVLRRRFRWRNVKVCEYAVAKEETTIPFYSFEDGSANNTASAEWADCITHADKNPWAIALPLPRTTYVKAKPLSYFLQAFDPVKYLKVDAEGFEDQVLSSLDRAVPLISLEFVFPYGREALAACLSKITAVGDYEFNAAVTEPPLRLELNRWLKVEEINKAIDQNRWLYVELYAQRVNRRPHALGERL
jgi:FkbM family methyltransferase